MPPARRPHPAVGNPLARRAAEKITSFPEALGLLSCDKLRDE
jgi:hypothetical protein